MEPYHKGFVSCECNTFTMINLAFQVSFIMLAASALAEGNMSVNGKLRLNIWLCTHKRMNDDNIRCICIKPYLLTLALSHISIPFDLAKYYSAPYNFY